MSPLRVWNQAGEPSSRLYEIAQRISRTFGPRVALAFLNALRRLDAGITHSELLSALASGNVRAVEAAMGASRLSAIFAGQDALADVLHGAATATGMAGAEVLEGITGLETRFNAVDPNAVMFARRQAAELVVAVSDDVREAIRIVTAVGQVEGLTIRQQAVAIRQVVGLPPNWVRAPLNLARELREGTFRRSRRLSAVDKARIGKRLREGTVTEEFVAEMQDTYAASLRNRRALNIARTETLRSANHGLRVGWRQAVDQGVLPSDARRVVVVTPDDRLRPSHARVPGMNRGGVGLNEPFRTPWGRLMGPPWEPNCRCGEGLVFPGRKGVL